MKYNVVIYFIYEYRLSHIYIHFPIKAEQALFAIAEQAFIYTSEQEHNDWTA